MEAIFVSERGSYVMSKSWSDILRPFAGRRQLVELLAKEFDGVRMTLDQSAGAQLDETKRLFDELKASVEAQTAAAGRWHEVLEELKTQSESSNDKLGHELRVLNQRTNSFFEPFWNSVSILARRSTGW